MKLSNPSHSINFGSVGLTQSGFRDWRRFHAKLGFKYWSEKALGTERKSRDDDAAAHLGGIIDVVPTGKENEGGKGHRLRLRPVNCGAAGTACSLPGYSTKRDGRGEFRDGTNKSQGHCCF